MSHPAMTVLALHAGGDLPMTARLRAAWHLRRCSRCRARVEALRRERRNLLENAPELPPALDWDSLAADMEGNIRVGLAAGECVAQPAPAPRRLNWRVAAALASVTVVVVSGWWLHLSAPPPVEGMVLAATSDGIEMKQQDWTLTLKHSSSEPVVVSVNVEGSVSAHYVDDETGMVTINNVYAE